MEPREERLRKTQELQQIREEVERELKQIPGVVGVGIGFRITGGETVEQIVFQVFVEEKKSPEEIPPEQMIPSEIRGIPTDVMTVPRGSAQADPTPGQLQKKRRPLAGGIQIQNNKSITTTTATSTTIQTSMGTLGCFAKLNGDNTGTYILSNEHVMLALGAAVGDKIAQDHYVDCICCDCNVVGIITNAVNNNLVDCAIAKLESDIAIVNEIVGIGTIQGSAALSTLAVGDPVKKVGCTTALTTGTIFSTSAPAIVDGKNYNNQILVTPTSGKFAEHGDSGSVVVNNDTKVIGLLFSGENASPFKGIINPIEAVMTALNITIMSGSSTGGGTSALVTRSSVIPVQSVQSRSLREEHPLHAFEAKLEQTSTGRRVLAFVRQHFYELSSLVNTRRPVTVIWRRKQGPAFLAALMRKAKAPDYEIPHEVEGISRQSMLMSMISILEDHASPPLRRDLQRYGLTVINAANDAEELDDILEALGTVLEETAFETTQADDRELHGVHDITEG
jgi:hypothetical protein